MVNRTVSREVDIPDGDLREKIWVALGKQRLTPITEAEMATLIELDAGEASITDLTGLEFATNLTYLYLFSNAISDISVLARLTKMRRLWLRANAVTDISVLTGLTQLTELDLSENAITDLSFLVENRGVTSGDTLRLRDNPLSAPSIQHIQTLQRRGVNVHR